MNNYYPRLRSLREDHDLSQKKVAEFLGIQQVQYSRYETGLRDLPTDILIRLAKFYETSSDYILELSDMNHPYEK